jgi:(p)ppGpp synthase/HD superfamily hydrolase
VASIVEEVTDDKLKSKEERKRLQVETAPHKSHSAKLVKMADKIYNLRDLEKSLPLGWDIQRRQEYFLWARDVVSQCYDENKALASILKDIFSRNIN